MRLKATRGVCVGIGDNMEKDEVREFDKKAADTNYLLAIGALVETDEPVGKAKAAPELAFAGDAKQGKK